MKKVLVTGAGGFIGSHLTEFLVERGLRVKAFIHYNSNNHRGWLEHSKLQKDIEFISGDIRDYDAVFEAIKDCDSVFHLAALIGIPYSYFSPLAYIRTNIEGTYNVLQSSKVCGLSNVLITSTSETYGSAQYVPINELHPVVGQSPYAATKISADQIALSFYRSFGLPVKIARPFNTYGPRQSARAIIPTIITQVLSGQESIKLGNMSPTRDFTYVKDTVAGFWAIAKAKKLYGEATNIGMNTEVAVSDLVKTISSLTGRKIKLVTDRQRVRPLKSEVQRLRCDNKKLRNSTNWKPKYSLKEGLKEVISFIERNFALYKSEIYNV